MPSAHGPKVEKFYHSTRWTKCRKAFVMMKYGKCDICGRAGNLVHHVIPLDETNVDNPDVSLNFDNLQLLCKECHNKVHGDIDRGMGDKPTVALFTPNGDVIIRDKHQKR